MSLARWRCKKTPARRLQGDPVGQPWRGGQRTLMPGCGRWVLHWHRMARIALGYGPGT